MYLYKHSSLDETLHEVGFCKVFFPNDAITGNTLESVK